MKEQQYYTLEEQAVLREQLKEGHRLAEDAYHDTLGDRMKEYELAESSRVLDRTKPIYIRLDGRSFSTFTKGLPRPYDRKLSWIMAEVTKHLMTQTKCDIAYTQSDEISLGWFVPTEEKTQLLFGGRIQKLVSVLAGMASAKFNQLCMIMGKEYLDRAMKYCPHFDARIYQPPTALELINSFVWREQDCKRNSVSMAAQAVFPHKLLQGKSSHQMREMLSYTETPYERQPIFFRIGSYFYREVKECPIPDHVPEKYRQGETMLRSKVVRIKKPAWGGTIGLLNFYLS